MMQVSFGQGAGACFPCKFAATGNDRFSSVPKLRLSLFVLQNFPSLCFAMNDFFPVRIILTDFEAVVAE